MPSSVTGHVARFVAGALLVALLPAVAAAQFASGLTPPPAPPSPEVVAAAESVAVAKRDSVVREQRLDMRAWVDSAAASLEAGGVAASPVPTSPGDTASTVPPLPATPPPQRTPPPRRPSPPASRPGTPPTTPPSPGFRAGMPAPDTATPLPALALLGGGMLAGGALMLLGPARQRRR